MKSVIKGAGYILCHVPDMVLHNGTTQTTEMIVNPDGDYLKELPSHIRSWEDVLAYWPNQVYIGNKTPAELSAVPQPFYQTPCDVTERYGHFGQMMPQQEFLLLMQACDVFDLVLLDRDFVAAHKAELAANPMIDEPIMARIKEGFDLAEIERLVREEHSEGLYHNGVLPGPGGSDGLRHASRLHRSAGNPAMAGSRNPRARRCLRDTAGHAESG